jgi:hypothetical protein
MFKFLVVVSEDPRRLGFWLKSSCISKDLNVFIFSVKQSDPSKRHESFIPEDLSLQIKLSSFAIVFFVKLSF